MMLQNFFAAVFDADDALLPGPVPGHQDSSNFLELLHASKIFYDQSYLWLGTTAAVSMTDTFFR